MEPVRQIEIITAALEGERGSVRDRGGGSVDFAGIIAGISGFGADLREHGRDRGRICQGNDGKSTQGCQSDGAGKDPQRDQEASPREIAQISSGDQGCEGEGERSEHERERVRNYLVLPITTPPQATDLDDVRGSPGRSEGIAEKDLKELVRRLHQSAVAGREKVQFSSKLEHATKVRFDVRIEGTKVFVTANVPDARTGALLTVSLDELRRRLTGCGLELAGFDVAMDGKTRKPHRDESSNKDVNSPGRTTREGARARRKSGCALDVIA